MFGPGSGVGGRATRAETVFSFLFREVKIGVAVGVLTFATSSWLLCLIHALRAAWPLRPTRPRVDRARRCSAQPYFHACLVAYVLGLGVTIIVMNVFKAAQPALFYLVPACLGSASMTALWRRGETPCPCRRAGFATPSEAVARAIKENASFLPLWSGFLARGTRSALRRNEGFTRGLSNCTVGL